MRPVRRYGCLLAIALCCAFPAVCCGIPMLTDAIDTFLAVRAELEP